MGLFVINHFMPHIPAVNAHQGIVDINDQIAIQIPLRKQININGRTDDTCWKHQNILLPGVKHTDHTKQRSKKFKSYIKCSRGFVWLNKELNQITHLMTV